MKQPSEHKSMCEEAFDWLFDHADPQQLLARLSKTKLPQLRQIVFHGGFSASLANLKIIRVRLRRNISCYSDEILFLLQLYSDKKEAPWNDIYKALILFTDQSLRANWRKILCSMPDPGIFVLALFNFPPDDWRGILSRRLLKIPQAWTPANSPRIASDRIPKSVQDWSRFILNIILNDDQNVEPEHSAANHPDEATASSQMPDGPKASTVPQSDTLPAVKPAHKPSASDEEISKLIRAANHQLRQELEQQFVNERRKKDAAFKQCQQALQDAEHKISELNEQLKKMDKDAKKSLTDIEQRLQQQQEAEVGSFLSELLQCDDSLFNNTVHEEIETSELLARVDQALVAQCDFNAKFGSKTLLRNQRQKLTEALDKLCLAAEDSFKDTAGLQGLIRTVSEHIDRINARLGDESAAQPILAQLEIAIASIRIDDDAEQRFGHLRTLITEAFEFGLITDNSVRQLEECINRRLSARSRLLDKRISASMGSLTRTENENAPRKILTFAAFLPHLKKVTLIIDGYNVIKRNAPWNSMESTHGFTETRNAFIQVCQAKLPCFDKLDLVFDGNQSIRNIERRDNLTITFAARKNDDQNADDDIIERLRFIHASRQSDSEIWLVTDDHGLIERASEFIDACVATFAFRQFFCA